MKNSGKVYRLASIVGSVAFSLLISGAAYAGYCGNCMIKTLGVGPHYDGSCASGSCVFVMMDGAVTGRPGCSLESWQFILDTHTDDGRKAYAMLLSAYSMGKAINISGNDTCTLYSASENFLYAMFAY